jgi:hypothetical protein
MAVLFAAFLLSAVVAAAASLPHQKGRFTAVFDRHSPLSDSESISKRLRIPAKPGPINKHHYAIQDESFEVYVPDTYDPNTPFGLLVWISANPDGGIERYQGIKELMDKHRLIWIGANRCGNEADVSQRRIPLALDAADNMRTLYAIDPDRVYVAGLSGGGRVASITALHHSDVYAGGIFIIGANYWERMSIPGQNGYWKANTTKPLHEYLLRAKESGRYVLLTGDTDENRLQMHTYYEKGFKKYLDHVLYMQIPGMGHQIPPPDAWDQALIFLDTPLPASPKQ